MGRVDGWLVPDCAGGRICFWPCDWSIRSCRKSGDRNIAKMPRLCKRRGPTRMTAHGPVRRTLPAARLLDRLARHQGLICQRTIVLRGLECDCLGTYLGRRSGQGSINGTELPPSQLVGVSGVAHAACMYNKGREGYHGERAKAISARGPPCFAQLLTHRDCLNRPGLPSYTVPAPGVAQPSSGLAQSRRVLQCISRRLAHPRESPYA